MGGRERRKVLHIALSHGGGVEVYTRMLIERTCEIFDTVLICAPEFNRKRLPENACTVYEADVPREISVRKDVKALFEIRKILRKEAPDILYCHSSMAGAIGRAAATGLSCKTVYNPHGWSFDMEVSPAKKKLYRFSEKLLAKKTDKIVTISEYEKRIALENKICAESKIQVILNGIDIDKCRSVRADRAAFGFGKTDFIIGCAARLSDQKDPMLFARVARCLSEKCPEARFVWVGDGELREEFITALKKNNVLEKTVVTGWTDDPYAYISVFDVAVLFSKWEGFGLCLAEYMAMGKPIVATNVGAVSEIIRDKDCGSLAKCRDPERIAEEILAYRQRQNPRETEQKCRKAAEEFDFKITADKTIKLLYDL